VTDTKCDMIVSFEGDRTIYRIKGCNPYIIKMQRREYTIYREKENGWEFVDLFRSFELAVCLVLEKARKM